MKHYYRAPSEKSLISLMRLDKAQAEKVRALLHGDIDPESYQDVNAWVRRCYFKPPYIDRLLCALNEVCGTYGAENLTRVNASYDDRPDYEYLNTGDTYRTTLIYSNLTSSFRLGCWGEIVERAPECRYEW